MKILIAGVGNVLLGDDAFGVHVARALSEQIGLSSIVTVFDAGIAGVAFVQELMDGYDALIVADAVDRGEAPGTIFVIEPEIANVDQIEPVGLHQSLVDAHYAEPSKVLLLARVLKVLPPIVYLVGCQPGCCDEPGAEMSPEVRTAVQVAIARIKSLVDELTHQTRDDAAS